MSLVTELSADFVTPSSNAPLYSQGPQGLVVKAPAVNLPGTSLRVVQVNNTAIREPGSFTYLGLPPSGIIYETPEVFEPGATVEEPPYELFPVSSILADGSVRMYYLPLYYNIVD